MLTNVLQHAVHLAQTPTRHLPKLLHPYCGDGLLTRSLLSIEHLLYLGLEPETRLLKQAKMRLHFTMAHHPISLEANPTPAIQALLLTPGAYDLIPLLHHLHPWLEPNGLCLFFIRIADLSQELSRWCQTHLIEPRVFAIHHHSLKHTRLILGQISSTPRDPAGTIQSFLKDAKLGTTPFTVTTCGNYTIPLPSAQHFHLYPRYIDQEEINEQLQRSPIWNDPTLLEAFIPKPQTAIQPLMPVKPCHLAMQIAAGVLNGHEVQYANTTLLIKGRTIKTPHQWEEDELGPDGTLHPILKGVETYSTIIQALDLQEGTLHAIT
mgnify:CR=1 FL=1